MIGCTHSRVLVSGVVYYHDGGMCYVGDATWGPLVICLVVMHVICGQYVQPIVAIFLWQYPWCAVTMEPGTFDYVITPSPSRYAPPPPKKKGGGG